MSNAQHDITGLLSGGEESVFPLVYEELREMAHRQMARERQALTLQTTALVHEAYLRLIGSSQDVSWNNRGHFFGAAAQAMRRILVDRARRYSRVKHGGGRDRVDFDIAQEEGALTPEADHASDVLSLDEALNGLETLDRRKWSVVMLLFFAGLTIDETAKALGVSSPTVKLDWRFAKAWLAVEMGNGD
ncbi:MAG: ECF-type sigma factor [Planctomycetota bacterium]